MNVASEQDLTALIGVVRDMVAIERLTSDQIGRLADLVSVLSKRVVALEAALAAHASPARN